MLGGVGSQDFSNVRIFDAVDYSVTTRTDPPTRTECWKCLCQLSFL